MTPGPLRRPPVDLAYVPSVHSTRTVTGTASRYGIAVFEDRRGRGVNYNLTIEVGGMLISGRRTAILKDVSVERLPTDLVGKIYQAVDLDDSSTASAALHGWLRDDIGLGPCPSCPHDEGPA